MTSLHQVRDGVPSHIIIGGIPKALAQGYNGITDVGANIESYSWPGGATMVIPLLTV